MMSGEKLTVPKITILKSVDQYMKMFKHDPQPTDLIRIEDVGKLLHLFGEQCFNSAREKLYTTGFEGERVSENRFPSFEDYLTHIKSKTLKT